MAHQTHYGPAIEKTMQAIAEGKIGDIVEIRGRGKEELSRGGGKDLIVLGPHIMDLMRIVAGTDPQWCSAQALVAGKPITKSNVKEDEQGYGLIAGEEIHASYGFPKMIDGQPNTKECGVMGYFSTRKSKHGAGHRYGMQIFGTKGILSIMDMGAHARVSLLQSTHWMPAAEFEKQPQWEVVHNENVSSVDNEAIGNRLLIEDLIKAIDTNSKPKCDATDGRWTIEMIMAAYESQRLNQPVEFPLKNRKHPLTLL